MNTVGWFADNVSLILSGLTHFNETSGFEIAIRSGLLRKPLVAADINYVGFA